MQLPYPRGNQTRVTTMPKPNLEFVDLLPGDPAPWFVSDSTSRSKFVFDSAAGHYIIMCFFGSAADAEAQSALRAVMANRVLFDDQKACFFGISLDPADKSTPRVSAALPGIRYLWDFDCAVSGAYGAVPRDSTAGASVPMRRFWLVLDPTLRVLRKFPLSADAVGLDEVFSFLRALPSVDRHAGIELQAPILFLPNIFETELCRALVGLHQAHGGEETGFMEEREGKTVLVKDDSHKRRRDYIVRDDALLRRINERVSRRIVPEISKTYQFTTTRIERYLVGCYSAQDGGHFRPHRDSTTPGTAHRRFAVSINLNDDFAGGDLSFPEYGPNGYRPPAGCAVVFSCLLLHAVSKVTRGRRYAFLPFLYDEAAARIRVENEKSLARPA